MIRAIFRRGPGGFTLGVNVAGLLAAVSFYAEGWSNAVAVRVGRLIVAVAFAVPFLSDDDTFSIYIGKGENR